MDRRRAGRLWMCVPAGGALADPARRLRRRPRQRGPRDHPRRLDALLPRRAQRGAGRAAAATTSTPRASPASRICRTIATRGAAGGGAAGPHACSASRWASPSSSRRSCPSSACPSSRTSPAWGVMIADARQDMYQAPWGVVLPILRDLPHRARLQSARRRAAPRARSAAAPARRRMTPLLEAQGITVVGARSTASASQVLRDLDLRARAGQRARPRRRIGRRQEHDRARHRAASCRPASRVAAGTLQLRGPRLVAHGAGERAARCSASDIAFIPQEPMTSLNPRAARVGRAVRRASRPARRAAAPSAAGAAVAALASVQLAATRRRCSTATPSSSPAACASAC